MQQSLVAGAVCRVWLLGFYWKEAKYVQLGVLSMLAVLRIDPVG